MFSLIPPYKKMGKMYHDVESLITNILVQETINYITEQIYVHKKLMPICLKVIIRRLLIKLAMECTFKFSSRFLKQVDGCTMEGSLCVNVSDIYMVKMENNVVIPSKPIFYHKFVDDIYNRQKLGHKTLFDQLSSYHPTIKLTIEVNPSKFLDTKLSNINGTYIFKTTFTMDLQSSKTL